MLEVHASPTAWLLLVPIGGVAFAVGAEGVSGTRRHAEFWLLLLLGPIGAAVVQSGLNGSAVGGGTQLKAVD